MLWARRFYLDLFYKSKKINFFFLLSYDQPRKYDNFLTNKVTCEKNDVHATVTLDADFDRQIHNNNTCGRLNVLFIARARHTSLVFPDNCIADTRVRHVRGQAAILLRVLWLA